MKLQFIKTDKCPVCGCDTVVSEHVETEFNSAKIRTHCSGGRWEYRKFACGYETHYCPNFFKEQKNRSCASDPKIIERDKKRKEAKSALCSTIASLDVDNEYKDRLEGAIKYI